MKILGQFLWVAEVLSLESLPWFPLKKVRIQKYNEELQKRCPNQDETSKQIQKQKKNDENPEKFEIQEKTRKNYAPPTKDRRKVKIF